MFVEDFSVRTSKRMLSFLQVITEEAMLELGTERCGSNFHATEDEIVWYIQDLQGVKCNLSIGYRNERWDGNIRELQIMDGLDL